MLKKIRMVLVIVFIAIQFFRPEKNVSSSPSANAIEKHFQVPQNVQMVLKRSCYDCHSNNTVYPWYNHIQPAAWFLASHVSDGKKELNFDEFSTYTAEKQKHKLEDISELVDKNEMPIGSYTFIHRNAVLSAAEKQQVIAWADSLRKTL